VNNEIITILGGAHPSAVPDEMLSDKNVDFVVIGEGELILRKLLEYIEVKKSVWEIEGIGFKRDGSIQVNGRKEYAANLDDLPFPYWDIFPLKKYYEINNPHGSPAKRLPFLPVITSRGCPFECIFCSVHNVWGRVYRARSAENVLSELSYLTDKFGVREILFEDDNLTLDKGRAMQIFKGIIDKDFDIAWNVPNGVAVQTLDGEMLKLMKRSGCYSISIGVESGDEYVLRNIIKKPIILSNIKPIIIQAKKLGLETTAFFVVGFPGETIKNIKNTFRFARSLNVDTANFFFASPLPGTRLLELFKEKNLMEKKLDYLKLKSDQPYSKTDNLTLSELTAIVYREKLKLYILSLLTNPGKFLHKLWRKLTTNPAYFIEFGNAFLKKR
jgi:magnesium-protoporphyrin IX monomethyl ester (oxidative) cyclase